MLNKEKQTIIDNINIEIETGILKGSYKNLETPDETWDGQSPLPNWLEDKISLGYKIEDFLVVNYLVIDALCKINKISL